MPQEVSAYNVNIACGSGMKATQLGAQQIALGDAEVVLVGGMENMTRVPFLLDRMRLGHRMGDATVIDAMYRDGLLDPLCGLIMGETAENLVDMYDIGRQEQDEFALESQQKARAGADRRAAEMFPIEVTLGQGDGDGRPGRASPAAEQHGDAGEARAGLPGGRQRHRRELQRHHGRRRGHGADERVARPRRGPRAPSRGSSG